MVRITSHMEKSIPDINDCMSGILFPVTDFIIKNWILSLRIQLSLYQDLFIQYPHYDYGLKPFDIAEILSVR